MGLVMSSASEMRPIIGDCEMQRPPTVGHAVNASASVRMESHIATFKLGVFFGSLISISLGAIVLLLAG